MVAYSFKGRFVEPIKASTKRQTIRAVGKRRHAQPGDLLQLYTGMRTRNCALIAERRCADVGDVEISVEFGGITGIQMNGLVLDREEMELFARNDGFADLADMSAFWLAEHGVGEFRGYVISWSA